MMNFLDGVNLFATTAWVVMRDVPGNMGDVPGISIKTNLKTTTAVKGWDFDTRLYIIVY